MTDAGSKGQTVVNNLGTLTMGAGNNNGNAYSISMVDPLIVSANTTLNIGDSQGDGAISTVAWNDNSNITVYGTLNFFALKDKGAKLLTNNGHDGYIDVASSQAGNGNIVFINTDPGKDATQEIAMGILQEAGKVKVSGDYWNITNAINNGQPTLYSVVVSAGTFTLGNKGSTDGVQFSFGANFVVDSWNNKGGNGFLDVTQNSKLTANFTGDAIDLNNGSMTVEADVLLTSTRMIIAMGANESFAITMYIDPTTNGSSQITMGTSTSEFIQIGNASLKVLVNGGVKPNANLTWTLFQAPNYNGQKSGIQGDFPGGKISFPFNNVLETQPQGNNTWQRHT